MGVVPGLPTKTSTNQYIGQIRPLKTQKAHKGLTDRSPLDSPAQPLAISNPRGFKLILKSIKIPYFWGHGYGTDITSTGSRCELAASDRVARAALHATLLAHGDEGSADAAERRFGFGMHAVDETVIVNDAKSWDCMVIVKSKRAGLDKLVRS